MTSVDPTVLYDGLLGEAKHPSKRRGLEVLQAICRERFEANAQEWSVASIGRLSEGRGGPNAGSLRQPRSEDYRALIKAWEQASEAAHSKVNRRKTQETADAWIHQIDDIVARQSVFMMARDIERARAEIRALKRRLPDGGVIKLPVNSPADDVKADNRIAPVPSQCREAKQFLDQFIENDDMLKSKGFSKLKDGSLVDADTGEVVVGRRLVELMKAIASISFI